LFLLKFNLYILLIFILLKVYYIDLSILDILVKSTNETLNLLKVIYLIIFNYTFIYYILRYFIVRDFFVYKNKILFLY